VKRLKSSRPETLQPREEDLQKLREMLREGSDLAEYVEGLCLFRMSVIGLVQEDKANTGRLSDLIYRLGRDELGRLPGEFEIARDILLRMREKRDFELVLGVRSTV